jgi:hypothetical protein
LPRFQPVFMDAIKDAAVILLVEIEEEWPLPEAA